ncbi:hypothetical protein EJ04DRAFT_132902 [Polyplosphaeria fusca]|uniref:Uncharacterized protein n=1 Tax=Polyplosphaeria fusca TaxID=682080 RepID=A0A9P4QI03_9PLEO|nr:hypothetical protein EJ04DRAFT_132902 [Polyplosphaeria fusca]
MPGLRESIEIAAPPSVVRAKFLAFDTLPLYHPNGFFRSISSEHCFRWVGSMPGVFTGEHIFRFEHSEVTPGGTTFSQEESFSGALSFLMGDNFAGRTLGWQEKSHKGWIRYNEDLKRWCEGGAEA